MSRVRTFIALELDDETRDTLARSVGEAAQLAPLVSWSRPEAFHATLKFLGDVEAGDLPELFDAVGDAVRDLPPFVWSVTGSGVFPHPRAPKVIWARVEDGREEMVALAKAIDEICAELGYPPEIRPYTPHVTLGRVKRPADAEGLPEALAHLEGVEFGVVDADAAIVYMSDLRRTGPVYAPMFHAPLEGHPTHSS